MSIIIKTEALSDYIQRNPEAQKRLQIYMRQRGIDTAAGGFDLSDSKAMMAVRDLATESDNHEFVMKEPDGLEPSEQHMDMLLKSATGTLTAQESRGVSFITGDSEKFQNADQIMDAFSRDRLLVRVDTSMVPELGPNVIVPKPVDEEEGLSLRMPAENENIQSEESMSLRELAQRKAEMVDARPAPGEGALLMTYQGFLDMLKDKEREGMSIDDSTRLQFVEPDPDTMMMLANKNEPFEAVNGQYVATAPVTGKGSMLMGQAKSTHRLSQEMERRERHDQKMVLSESGQEEGETESPGNRPSESMGM